MPQLQLTVSVFLVCCAILSGVTIFYQTRPADREVQLPINDDESSGMGDESQSKDPFEVTMPEDVIDGYPIAEQEFWTRVRFS